MCFVYFVYFVYFPLTVRKEVPAQSFVALRFFKDLHDITNCSDAADLHPSLLLQTTYFS